MAPLCVFTKRTCSCPHKLLRDLLGTSHSGAVQTNSYKVSWRGDVCKHIFMTILDYLEEGGERA